MTYLLFLVNTNLEANMILPDQLSSYSVILCTLPCLAEPFQCDDFRSLVMSLSGSYLFVSEINESLIKAYKHSLLFSA